MKNGLFTLFILLITIFASFILGNICSWQYAKENLKPTQGPPEPSPTYIYNTYYDKDTIETIAKMVNSEAKGESDKGQQAVIQVLKNRQKQYNQDYITLIKAKNQFTISDTYTEKEIKNVLYTLYYGIDFPEGVLYFGTKPYRGTDKVFIKIGNHYFMY